MKRLISNTLCSIILLASASVWAQGASTTDDGEQQANLSYEVVISSTITRDRLRELIVQVEDDFFAKFNELNADDNYDVLCFTHRPSNSYITKRICEAKFVTEARSEFAAETGNALGRLGQYNDGFSGPQSMQSNEAPKYEILQEKLEEFARTDEEFRSIGNALAKLRARLENYGKED